MEIEVTRAGGLEPRKCLTRVIPKIQKHPGAYGARVSVGYVCVLNQGAKSPANANSQSKE